MPHPRPDRADAAPGMRVNANRTPNHHQLLYSTCVTVALAMRAQNADHDQDMARCLRQQVTGPLSVQAEVLHAIVAGLKRDR